MTGTTYHRKCLRITAWDSPNVRLAQYEQSRGLPPSDTVVVPGVLSWGKLQYKLATFNDKQKCESIGADWYEGAALKLVPVQWLDAAEYYADRIAGLPRTGPRSLGVDIGAGGDDSAWAVTDAFGLLALESFKTPDTNMLGGFTLDMMRRWNVPPERTVFDLGGGGQFVAQRLRAGGFNVRATGFGKAPSPEVKRAGVLTGFEERREVKDEAYAYVNRRSEMAWDLRMLFERREGSVPEGGTPGPHQALARDGTWWDYVPVDSATKRYGFALPQSISAELRRQIEVVPLDWDAEDRFKLIPKKDPKDPSNSNTFQALIGRSPDQFDALCLSIFGATHKPVRLEATAR
jgi:hypothetical protein